MVSIAIRRCDITVVFLADSSASSMLCARGDGQYMNWTAGPGTVAVRSGPSPKDQARPGMDGASAVSEPLVPNECRIRVVTSEVKAARKRCIRRVRRQMRQVRHGQVRCQVASDDMRSRNVAVSVEATIVLRTEDWSWHG